MSASVVKMPVEVTVTVADAEYEPSTALHGRRPACRRGGIQAEGIDRPHAGRNRPGDRSRGLAIALPNWSMAVAVHCTCPAAAELCRVVLAGLTASDAAAWSTVTLTVLVAASPP